ncbi:cellulase family glycosylhydrolase [Histomonas meleagridis]|uniref:cellulase family glycosylhydrolase n=1 Tax=Histomonas meleagridis TaxID=135588 RepID=UPI00355A9BF3|nr:cellulase family glycosylhydrolase [Histomonas meleagridis]KAH0806001.1 cellulase family glycosylhydrolase [Histomonas meleagridis]
MCFWNLLFLVHSEVVRVEDFTSDRYFSNIPNYAELTQYNGRSCLKVQWTDESTKLYTHGASYNFTADHFAKRTLIVTAWIASENVSPPKDSWNGVKLMYSYKKNNQTVYPGQSTIISGTHPWTEVTYKVTTYAMDNVSAGNMFLGLQDSTGTVYFSNMTFEVVKTIEPEFLSTIDYQCEYTQRVLSRSRARGAMSPTKFKEEDFEDFKSWNGNIFRWQLTSYEGDYNNLTQYNEWINYKLDELELVFQKAEELKIWIVIDMHQSPGGRSGGNIMYENETFHNLYIEIWKTIATRFKDCKMLWAYDLINEPSHNSNAFIDYLQSQYQVAKIIREIDPYTPIIIEFNFQSDAYRYIYYALPLKDIFYSIHIYIPHKFTHQGVLESCPNNSGSYPGSFDGTYYNKSAIENYYKTLIDFQKAHNAKIFMGEFSAILWAKGAEDYIEDVIKIAEERNWDWTYHAFREWNGWSVEHEWINGPRVETTKRKEILLKYFKNNLNATEPWIEPDKTGTIIGLVVTVLVIVVIAVVIIVALVKRRSKK